MRSPIDHAPRQRPILFSAPMVRAVLANAKTQTRRILKPQPEHVSSIGPLRAFGWQWRDEEPFFSSAPESMLAACPYGVPGEQLWVREAWQIVWTTTDPEHGVVDAWGAREGPIPKTRPKRDSIVYAADEQASKRDGRGFDWRPSIHMPRWASRLSLEIVSIRVERVQDICDADIAAEGVTAEAIESLWEGASSRARAELCDVLPDSGDYLRAGAGLVGVPLINLWRIGCTFINGAESWARNDWCWVIGFRPLAARAMERVS